MGSNKIRYMGELNMTSSRKSIPRSTYDAGKFKETMKVWLSGALFGLTIFYPHLVGPLFDPLIFIIMLLGIGILYLLVIEHTVFSHILARIFGSEGKISESYHVHKLTVANIFLPYSSLSTLISIILKFFGVGEYAPIIGNICMTASLLTLMFELPRTIERIYGLPEYKSTAAGLISGFIVIVTLYAIYLHYPVEWYIIIGFLAGMRI